MICGSGGSKSRLAKAAGAEPSGQMRDEKVHAVVARSTFASEKAKNTSRSEHYWKLRGRKSARRCGAKHISKSKCQNTPCSDHFSTFRCRFASQAQGIVHLVKSEQNVRILEHFQKPWQAWGILQRICKDAFSVAGAVQETFSSELLGGPGADFLRGVAFWSIRSSSLMILRDRCSTSYDLASLFRGRGSSLDRWTGKIAKHIGTRPSALHSTFHF